MKRSETSKKIYAVYLLEMYQFSKKSIRRLLSVLYSLLRVPKTFTERRRSLSNNNVLVQIDISAYSRIILRDLLISLNIIGNHISSSENSLVNLSLYIYRDVKHIDLGDIFTCCQLYPFIGDIHFVLSDSLQADNNAIVHGAIKDIKVLLDGVDLQLQGKDYFKSVYRNCLRVPQLSTRVWASNILKTFKPASFIVCFDVPASVRGNDLSEYIKWRHFFMRVWANLPRIHFLLLNYSLEWGKEFAVDLPNVTITKMLGYNLLEEFAIVQAADMYVGSYDTYAAVVIGSEKPCLLFGVNETDRNTLAEFIDPTSQLLSERQNQLLIAEDISPDCLYNSFKRFYMDLSARH